MDMAHPLCDLSLDVGHPHQEGNILYPHRGREGFRPPLMHDLIAPSQIPANEAVQEHREHDQGDDDVGEVALPCEGKDRERHPRDRGGN